MDNASTGRKRQIIGNILIFLGGFTLIVSASMKFAQVPKVASMLAALGFEGERLMLIAILEVLCAVLFLIPYTRSVGLLLVSAYLGGAISAHIGHGQLPFQPAFVLALFWIGAWLRHPEVLWSLGHNASATIPFAQKEQQRSAPQGI